MRHFATEWRGVAQFAARRPPPRRRYSRALVDEYLASRAIPLAGAIVPRHAHIHTSMRILSEFAEFGCCQRRRRTSQPDPLARPMATVLAAYDAYCVGHARIGARSM